ncbi:TPR-like protein [Westerdykella ornata]|uniref:TPR-like protein n=1 Tax=Westerdykella ornata TaxID=318751 RepID=A0A6A6J8Z3_WESOR|nr:TPR-like protein [Westerdykella ornata]KAF2272633.1 TPR-like protein [Westerdykella ornata]
MEKHLREWRTTAVNKNQYETAIFVADKLLALTKDDNDAFWLAQAHFRTGNYSRAQTYLSRGQLIERNPQCRYLHAQCSIKLGKIEEALDTLGEQNPTHLISQPDNRHHKLRHVDVNVRSGRHKAALRSDRVPTSEEREREDSTSLKFEAGMCYLRGMCFAKQNAFDRAKECFKTAVQIDVQCFEAFDELMSNALMSPAEEWAFLESLDFDMINVEDNPSLSQEAAEFTKTLYITRLSKYGRPAEFTDAAETLSTHYNLSDNPDILLSKAELLFTNCQFRNALALTSYVLKTDKYNFAGIPIHVACLHELGEKNALFLLAHDLVDNHPQEPAAWLAVGTYYFSIHRIAEARRFFSKASVMNPHFGSAWIGFAHTFSAEGEHDQAISAYSTAARLFQGTHLPQLFLGMENLQLNNLSLAHEYLNTAYELCKDDPLLLNEMGVVFYQEENFPAAIEHFQRAIAIAEQNEADHDALLPTRNNLAHALRQSGHLEEALDVFDEVLRHGDKDVAVFSAKGLVLLQLGRSWDAIVTLHEALAIDPQATLATDLLNKAFAENESEPIANDEEEFADLDRKVKGRLAGQGKALDSMMLDSDI